MISLVEVEARLEVVTQVRCHERRRGVRQEIKEVPIILIQMEIIILEVSRIFMENSIQKL